MRIILVGYGWRSFFYYRIIKALPQQFTLVRWVLRSKERAEEVTKNHHVETTSSLLEALSCPHDLVVLSVPSYSMESLMDTLIDHNETVLCETGFTPLPIETLISLYTRYKESRSIIFVAEQYYRYPYYQMCNLLLPLLGPITEVHLARLHDHHGTSLIRHFLNEKGNDCTISATCRTSWIVKTEGRDTIDTKGVRIQTKRTTACFSFEDEKTGYYDFADVQYHSSIRSSHFSLRGERGEIFDDTIRYLNVENEGLRQNLERIEDGCMNNNPRSLRTLTFGTDYQFRNPYWPLSFNDDEIALALCLEDACKGKGYSLADALQDSYLAQCMEVSCREKRPVQTKRQVWADELSAIRGL